MERHGGRTRAQTEPVARPARTDTSMWTFPDQARAFKNLIRADRFDDRPCKNPLDWDMPEVPTGTWSHNEAARLAKYQRHRDEENKRRRQCHECPVFTECRAYLKTRPNVIGVLAGTTDAERGGRRKKRKS